MSTQFYTQDQPTTSQPDTGHRAPRPQGDGPSWFRIWTIVIGTVVAAALIVLAAVGLTRSHTTPTPAPIRSPCRRPDWPRLCAKWSGPRPTTTPDPC